MIAAVWRRLTARDQPPAFDNRLLNSTTFIHSLRSPLSTLLVNLELALQTIPDRTHRRNLNQALHSAQYLQELLGLFSRAETSADIAIVNIKEVLESLVVLTAQDGRQLVVSTNVDQHDQVIGHRVLLQEVLSCLLNNAFEACSNCPKTPVVLSVIKLRRHYRFQVQDFGVGMGPLRQKLALRKGWSAKTSTGLGLWFVKHVLEQSFGSSLLLTSHPNQGTTVWFYLASEGNTAKDGPKNHAL